jgi:hypothetical protein
MIHRGDAEDAEKMEDSEQGGRRSWPLLFWIFYWFLRVPGVSAVNPVDRRFFGCG